MHCCPRCPTRVNWRQHKHTMMDPLHLRFQIMQTREVSAEVDFFGTHLKGTISVKSIISLFFYWVSVIIKVCFFNTHHKPPIRWTHVHDIWNLIHIFVTLYPITVLLFHNLDLTIYIQQLQCFAG